MGGRRASHQRRFISIALMLFGRGGGCQEGSGRDRPRSSLPGTDVGDASRPSRTTWPERDGPDGCRSGSTRLVPLERNHRECAFRETRVPGAAAAAGRSRLYTPPMDRRSALVLLAVFGTGVFLAGPRADDHGGRPAVDPGRPRGCRRPSSAWIELRKASWIINGYLLVYILTMPMAGRLADLWGARRLFLGALVVFIVGSALAGDGPEPRPADRRPPRPGHRRRASSCRSGRPPPRTCSRATPARGRSGSSAR